MSLRRVRAPRDRYGLVPNPYLLPQSYPKYPTLSRTLTLTLCPVPLVLSSHPAHPPHLSLLLVLAALEDAKKRQSLVDKVVDVAQQRHLSAEGPGGVCAVPSAPASEAAASAGAAASEDAVAAAAAEGAALGRAEAEAAHAAAMEALRVEHAAAIAAKDASYSREQDKLMEANCDLEEALAAAMAAGLHGLFRRLDTDGDGRLSRAELKHGLEADAEAKALLGERELMAMQRLDLDGDGEISWEEFSAVLAGEKTRVRFEAGKAAEVVAG